MKEYNESTMEALWGYQKSTEEVAGGRYASKGQKKDLFFFILTCTSFFIRRTLRVLFCNWAILSFFFFYQTILGIVQYQWWNKLMKTIIYPLTSSNPI